MSWVYQLLPDFFYATPSAIHSHCCLFEIFNEKQTHSHERLWKRVNSLHFLLEKVNPTKDGNKKTLIVALPVTFGIVFIVVVVAVAVLFYLKKSNSSKDKMILLKSISHKCDEDWQRNIENIQYGINSEFQILFIG